MTPMDYGPDWRPPWRHTEQARCKGRLCVADGLLGRLVMACTLNAEGLCVNCARTPANMHPDLDDEPQEDPAPVVVAATPVVDAVPAVEQLGLGL